MPWWNLPLRMVRLTSWGITSFAKWPNSCLTSCCKIGDSAKPPTRNRYFTSTIQVIIGIRIMEQQLHRTWWHRHYSSHDWQFNIIFNTGQKVVWHDRPFTSTGTLVLCTLDRLLYCRPISKSTVINIKKTRRAHTTDKTCMNFENGSIIRKWENLDLWYFLYRMIQITL